MEKSAGERKLKEALSVFFDGEYEKNTETYKKAEKYLQLRIRSAMEVLIEKEDTEKMDILEQQGWFGAGELETFLKIAREKEKKVSLMWLLHLKNNKYGYRKENLIF